MALNEKFRRVLITRLCVNAILVVAASFSVDATTRNIALDTLVMGVIENVTPDTLVQLG